MITYPDFRFYHHPQTTREDRNPLTTDHDGSVHATHTSDVLKGGVPKTSSMLEQPTVIDEDFLHPILSKGSIQAHSA